MLDAGRPFPHTAYRTPHILFLKIIPEPQEKQIQFLRFTAAERPPETLCQ
jgi:hypothetical protein